MANSSNAMYFQGNDRNGPGHLGEARKIMGRDRLLVLAIFALIVGAAMGFRYLRGGAGVKENAIGGPPQRPSAAGEFRGISIQLYYSDPNHPYEEYIDEIAQTGANTVCFVVAAYQENAGSASIFIEARKAPSDQKLIRLFDHARKRGLRTVLMPIVLLESPREGEWRGKINPGNWDDWWEDYTNYVLHYANLCEQGKVEILMVGSELVSTETQEDRWRGLIKQVRKAFKHDKGRLSYSSNWDHYKPIAWWDDLDIIGMTTYYDLTGGKKPTMDVLMEAWKPIKKEILEWQAKINRPILFTEVGWPNQETCAQYPWDYYRSSDKPDPQAQKNCFDAFFQTWFGEKAVAGFLVWEWRNSPAQVIDEKKGTDYIPCGKPAMQVIREYYGRERAPSSMPSTATATSSKPAGS